MNWEDLRVFAALAQTGSLAGAGRLLRVNHATVSRRIAALEAALKLKLVDKLPRSTPLTEAGNEIAALAAQMQASADAISRRARGRTVELSGSVSVNAPPIVTNQFIAPRLGALLARYPRLMVKLEGELGLVSLDRGEADIAVRVSSAEPPAHASIRLGSVRLALYASPAVAATPAEGWTFIAGGPGLSHLPHYHWFERHIGKRAIALRSSDVVAQQQAACAGLGVVMLPRFVGDREPRLIAVDLEAEMPVRSLWLMIHPDVRRSAAVRAVAEHLTAIFAADPAFD